MAKVGRPRKTKDYRELKKTLNAYHNFSFQMPRKGKDFSPQQKSAITRQWKKLHNIIEGVEEGRISYIKQTKKRKIKREVRNALHHTNKGVFINVRNAKLTPSGFIKSEFMERKEIFLPLPKELYKNPSLIPDWLKDLHKKYFPATIMLSFKDRRGRIAMDPMDMEKYFYDAFMHFGGEQGTKNRINGVFLSTFDAEEFIDIYNITEEDYKTAKRGGIVRGEPLTFDPKKKPKYVVKVFSIERGWFTHSEYADTFEEALNAEARLMSKFNDPRFYIVTRYELTADGYGYKRQSF